MKILALETSTLMGSAALVIDGKVIAEKSSGKQRSHSEVLNTFIEEVLQIGGVSLADIDCFAVGKGPGSFTGLRIAGNVGKTLAYSYKKPMVAIDSLTLLAAATAEKKLTPEVAALPVFSILNAYKNMVYYGLFKNIMSYPEFIAGPAVILVISLGSVLSQKSLIVGDGFGSYEGYFPESISHFMCRDLQASDQPMASTLGRLATTQVQSGLTLDWKSYVPLYIRASEAEETKRGIFITSL